MPIVLANQAQMRSFKGVDFVLLAVGEKSMVTKMLYKPGNFVPFHSHANEQSGYVISGRYRLHMKECESAELNAGDTYSILPNVEHSMEIIEAGEVVDVFTPPRQDYL
jgi:quercetin dioxygenase-like cupin family protein